MKGFFTYLFLSPSELIKVKTLTEIISVFQFLPFFFFPYSRCLTKDTPSVQRRGSMKGNGKLTSETCSNLWHFTGYNFSLEVSMLEHRTLIVEVLLGLSNGKGSKFLYFFIFLIQFCNQHFSHFCKFDHRRQRSEKKGIELKLFRLLSTWPKCTLNSMIISTTVDPLGPPYKTT